MLSFKIVFFSELYKTQYIYCERLSKFYNLFHCDLNIPIQCTHMYIRTYTLYTIKLQGYVFMSLLY